MALPVVDGGQLVFADYRPDTKLGRGSYGIPQPDIVRQVRPSVVLAPLVAFTADGRRLGMGGGYYDRYFASAPDARRVGIAHECQRAQHLPADVWDVPLHAVVTENGLHWC